MSDINKELQQSIKAAMEYDEMPFAKPKPTMKNKERIKQLEDLIHCQEVEFKERIEKLEEQMSPPEKVVGSDFIKPKGEVIEHGSSPLTLKLHHVYRMSDGSVWFAYGVVSVKQLYMVTIDGNDTAVYYDDGIRVPTGYIHAVEEIGKLGAVSLRASIHTTSQFGNLYNAIAMDLQSLTGEKL